MKTLLDLWKKSPDGKVGDYLLNYKDVDKKILKMFLDIAMPAVSKSSYMNCAAYERLNSIVTQSEEAFAFLIFENNVERWIFNAKRDIVDNGGSLQGDDVGRDEDIAKSDPLPFTKYQVNCKNSKKEGKFVGKWTDIGFQRYNELLLKVKNMREERLSTEFEDELKKMYFDEHQSTCGQQLDNIMPILKKSKAAVDECVSVTVMNVLTFAV